MSNFLAAIAAVSDSEPSAIPLTKYWYLLADGTCVIDIFHKGGTISDTGNFNQIRYATLTIFDECVQMSQAWSGGYVRDVGDLKNLVIVISLFKPSVTCFGSVQPIPSVRQAILDTIPTDWNPATFGPPNKDGVDVTVPRTFSIPPVPGK